MEIKITGIPVKNQEKALKFHTEKLGFIKKRDISLGDEDRWLTVVSKSDQDGTELLLEPAPNHFEPAKIYQDALFKAEIPCTQFNVDNIQKEYERLTGLDVKFIKKPNDVGLATIAVLDDTCGNLIQLVEEKE